MTPQRRAESLLLFATFIWGSTFVVTKGILNETSPLLYTTLRFLSAACIVAALFPRRIIETSRNVLLPGLILGSLLFSGFALQTIGLKFTTASKSAFFTGMLVVFTPIFHFSAQRWLKLPRKTLRLGNLLGVLCSAGGLYMMTAPGGGGFTIGDGMTLVAAAIFAVYIVYLDHKGKGLEKAALTFVTFLSCGVEGGLLALGMEEVSVRVGWAFFLPLAYLTIFATVIALGIQNRYQGDTTPTRAAVIFALEPVIAAVLAFYFMGEQIGTAGVIGGSIIFAGLMLSELSDNLPGLNIRVVGTPPTSRGNG